MERHDFIKRVASKIEGATQKTTAVYFEAFDETIAEILREGESIMLPSVGKFTIKEVPEKSGLIGFGERKGQTWTTPAHNEPCFRVAPAFKNSFK